eukprot:UN24026
MRTMKCFFFLLREARNSCAETRLGKKNCTSNESFFLMHTPTSFKRCKKLFLCEKRLEDFDFYGPDPDILFPQIFFDCCPATVILEIVVKREFVEKLKVLENDLEQFLK